MWISARQAARRLGVNPHAVPRVAAAAGIRRRALPATAVKYLAEDVDRVLAESIVEPGTPQEADAPCGQGVARAGA
jgi:hypothetical protein